MTGSISSAETQSNHPGITGPVLSVFCVWAISTIIYNHAWQFLEPSLHRPLAVVCAVLMATSILFGAVVIYPIAFFRGVSYKKRILACFVIPFAWILKELIAFPDFYSLGETLYYAFIPVFLGILSLMVTEMGLAELFCRRVRKRRQGNSDSRVFSTVPVVAVIGGLTAQYFFSYWDDMVGFWYLYQSLSQILFLS